MNKTIMAGLIASLTPMISGASTYINQSVNDSVVEAGDMLQIMLPATGLFAAWLYDDAEGAKQLAYSTLGTQLIVHSVKETVGRNRPDESSWNSFPSGHTAAAFSGAAFLQTRYGAKWGVPAYAAATFVGASRLHGNRHYAGDVVAGASTAFLMNQLVVSPHKTEGVYFSAQPTKDGFALGVTVTDEVLTASAKPHLTTKTLNHKLEMGIGFNMTDSSAQALAAEYMVDDGTIDKYQPFSYVNYQYQLGSGDSYELEFLPSETRRHGTAAKNFRFDNVEFKQGEKLLTAFRHWILGNSMYKGVQLTEEMKLDVGLGLYLHMVEVDVDSEDIDDKSASEDHWRAMPSATLKFAYSPIESISLATNVQYQGWEKDSYMLAEVGMNYHINPAWDVGLKYSFTQTDLDNSEFIAKYDSNNLVLTFANRF